MECQSGSNGSSRTHQIVVVRFDLFHDFYNTNGDYNCRTSTSRQSIDHVADCHNLWTKLSGISSSCVSPPYCKSFNEVPQLKNIPIPATLWIVWNNLRPSSLWIQNYDLK